MALFDEVKSVIVEQLSVNSEEIKLESSFVEDLNADSLDVVEMIMALEEKFGIEIPDQDAEGMKTVQDVVAYIEKCTQK
ncbi:MAG: acyl carrier protein [Helicobacter sp.]|nr:acyl carrier protein [Helicobacter sp.]